MAEDRQNGTDDLDSRIARAKVGGRPVEAGKPAKGYSQGSRVLAELIGAPTGAAIIGWLLDKLAGTAPWIMLVMLALGIVVAFRNIFRISKERAE